MNIGDTGYLLFFFNDTATTEIYTLSLHDALPIYTLSAPDRRITSSSSSKSQWSDSGNARSADRKSTRLNSSHGYISYAVFCLKKKKQTIRLVFALYSAGLNSCTGCWPALLWPVSC